MPSIQSGPVFSPLLSAAPLNELGPGKPDNPARKKLTGISLDEAFAPHRIVDHDMAQCCLAGLLLLYDCFDESHSISQSIATASGSYWHGILHRREPDYGNAKYWFRRVGRHPVFEPLADAARDLAVTGKADRAAAFLGQQESWDPFRFVDLCAAVAAGESNAELVCRRVQRKECELLFEHCFRAAIGE